MFIKLKTIFLIGVFVFGVLNTTVFASLLIDRIVAIVENDVITENELIERMNVIRAQAGDQANLPSDDILAEQVLNRMIMERLQVEWGQRRGIEIDDLSLDQAMRNLAQRNRMDLDQFRNALLQQGIDYVTFRNQVRTEMLIGQVLRRGVEANVQVSEQEIDALINSQKDAMGANTEYRLSHILIQLPQDPTPADIENAKTEIEKIRLRAVDGESFTQLAIAHSQAQDALEGGDLGWRNKSQMPDMFARQVSKMRPGEISDVLRSGSGFHIFRILDTRGNDRIMVEQVLSRHILIRTNAVRSDDEVEQVLSALRTRIVNGEDFAELAKAHSEDPASAVEGGSLGWQAPSIFAPAFREIAKTIELNEVSQPFKSRFGWHIMQVQDRREHDNSQAAMRNEAREFLRQRKMEEETEIWLRQLRDESYVENRLLTPAEETVQ